MDEKKYYLGLDIGTDSVGYCVTDRDYNIITKRAVRYDSEGERYYTKKHLWGARLFDEAQTAATRRQKRTNRRRLARRRWRILLLQDLFRDEMNKVDDTFFDRLNNSALYDEDKPENIRGTSLIFADEKKESQFRKKYPTIYHLRKAMREEHRRFDIREIYLVFAHMVKYRGNFLHDGTMGQGVSDTRELKDIFDQIDYCMNRIYGDTNCVPFSISEDRCKQLLDRFLKLSKKQELLDEEKSILDLNTKEKNKTDIREEVLRLINGSNLKVSVLFPSEKDTIDKEDDISIDCSSDTFEETLSNIGDLLSDDHSELVSLIKKIYDTRVLVNILQGKQYLSDAMVESYATHKRQLTDLKRLFKKYLTKKDYDDFFRSDKVENNYVHYVKTNYIHDKFSKGLSHGKTTQPQEDFYKALKEKLRPIQDTTDEEDKRLYDRIIDAIDEKKYLPLQNSKDNSVLPYQLNLQEMKAIIDNQKEYYPFLAEEDTDYQDPEKRCYKALSILTFRVPYFVGPLSQDKDRDADKSKYPNQWAVFKEKNTKITPWNFYEVIDVEESGGRFIDNLKNKCTYLIGEPVLPRQSLLYTLFILLNEMNNWLINGEPLTEEIKSNLIKNVYLQIDYPKKEDIERELKRLTNETEINLSTRNDKPLDEQDMHAGLTSWRQLIKTGLFTQDDLLSENDNPKRESAEKIIFINTTFEDIKTRKARLKKEGFSDEECKIISRLNFKKWGSLSKRLLDGMTSPDIDINTGEEKDLTIIQIMMKHPLNFQEIYETSGRYTFKEQVEELNSVADENIESAIEDSYLSPAMKRSVYQTFKVIDELKKILKIDHFDTYFVECTREKRANKRTRSRKKQLEDIYKTTKDISTELIEQLEKKDDAALRSDKLFLYFLQLGKSVYSGKPIDLDNLEKYDIDHIIPRAKLKDDSIKNRVLVEKDINLKKQDDYPIPSSIITEEGRKHIEFLHSIKPKGNGDSILMPAEKYNALIRTKPLTDEELVGFVNRQLVSTNQSVKMVIELLKKFEKDSKVVYSKAGLVSDFRNEFDLVKSRDVNDFHHAHDAYLNIVVGNVYNKVLTENYKVQIYRYQQKHFEQSKFDAHNFFTRDQRQYQKDTIVWKAKKYLDPDKKIEDLDSVGTIDLIRKNLSLNDPMISVKTYVHKGFMSKVSLRSPTKGEKIDLPLKQYGPFKTSPDRYGGYNDLTAPYFILVRSEGKRGKHIYSLENIPAVYESQRSDSFDKEYLTDKLKLKNPVVLISKVPIKMILRTPDGACLMVNSKSNNRIWGSNSTELYLPVDYVRYIKSISKFLDNKKQKQDYTGYYDKDDPIEVGTSELTKERNQALFDWLCDNTLQKKCYVGIPGLGNTLQLILENKEQFRSFSTYRQVKILDAMIKVLQKDNCGINMRLFDAGADSVIFNLSQKQNGKNGIISFSKILTSGTQLIAVSITGFYQKILYTIPDD